MNSQKKRQFLLIPSIPTPNGRLHLGHIVGPFLKMDILKRFNQQINNSAFLYGGTDCHDSYVLSKAIVEKKSPEEVCFYFHEAIKNDLKKMSIDMDGFINPLAININAEYRQLTAALSVQLLSLKDAIKIEEEYPLSNEIGYLPPSFINGLCPQCKENMSGLICEKCGLTYKPEEILEKSSKLLDGNIEVKKVKNWFLFINKKRLINELISMDANVEAIKIVEKYCDETRKIRLTLPIEWGVEAENHLTYYNRGTFFPYCLLLAKICQKEHNLASLPFSINSSVETVGSFGFDNITTFMADTLSHAIVLEGYQGFNHYLPNKFMKLNGLKFSTSRNHAIWVEKLPNKIEIDFIRLFLLKKNSDINENDFNVNEFVEFYNYMAMLFNETINAQLTMTCQNRNSSFRSELKNLLNKLIDKRITYLMPENYDADKIYSDVMNCFLNKNDFQSDFYVWLQALSIAIYPVMPNISLRLWSALSLQGMPKYSNFNLDISERNTISLPKLNLINASDIEVG